METFLMKPANAPFTWEEYFSAVMPGLSLDGLEKSEDHVDMYNEYITMWYISHVQKRKPDWCTDGEHDDGTHDIDYHDDGDCECGVYKHHYHCRVCGGISQVG